MRPETLTFFLFNFFYLRNNYRNKKLPNVIESFLLILILYPLYQFQGRDVETEIVREVSFL